MSDVPETKIISIGEMDTVVSPNILKTTVGSCIALVLFDKRKKLFGMAHIMLPAVENPKGPVGDPGKYADTAIIGLLHLMQVPMVEAYHLQAKLAGGANMFAPQIKVDTLQVGIKNTQAVNDILSQLGVRVLGVDCGGVEAREVWIDSAQVKVFVKTVTDGQTREL